jgi:hypothetical protein
MATDFTNAISAATNSVLRDLGPRLGVEIVGSSNGTERLRMRADVDGFEIRIALPKRYGVVLLDSWEFCSSTTTALLDILVREIENTRDRMRGEMLVELANGEFQLHSEMTDEQWQLMERAGLRIMAAVERNRKERG